jgi:hypothetical protein
MSPMFKIECTYGTKKVAKGDAVVAINCAAYAVSCRNVTPTVLLMQAARAQKGS